MFVLIFIKKLGTQIARLKKMYFYKTNFINNSPANYKKI